MESVNMGNMIETLKFSFGKLAIQTIAGQTEFEQSKPFCPAALDLAINWILAHLKLSK